MMVRSTRNVYCGYTITQLISAAVKLLATPSPGLLGVTALGLSPAGALPELFGHHGPPPGHVQAMREMRQAIRHWHPVGVPMFHGVSYGNDLVAHRTPSCWETTAVFHSTAYPPHLPPSPSFPQTEFGLSLYLCPQE
jgi:hypothetical protein